MRYKLKRTDNGFHNLIAPNIGMKRSPNISCSNMQKLLEIYC